MNTNENETREQAQEIQQIKERNAHYRKESVFFITEKIEEMLKVEYKSELTKAYEVINELQKELFNEYKHIESFRNRKQTESVRK